MKAALTLTLMTLVCASGCSLGNYRVVKKTQTGGEIALLGVRDEAQEKANGYMASVCPKGFTVLEEGEAVVGQVGEARSEKSRGMFNTQGTTTRSETQDKTEWRVKYQCKDAPEAKAAGKVHEVVVRF